MSTPLSLFDLVEAFGQPGCPVCRLIEKDVDIYLHTLLFEGYRFPENHEKFRAGRGLCGPHAWYMAKHYRGALVNMAAYYRGAIAQVARLLEDAPPAQGERGGFSRLLKGAGSGPGAGAALADRLEPDGPCLACLIADSSEERNTRTLGEFISDSRLADAYRASEGLCLPHFRMALRRAKRPADSGTLAALQRGVWEALLAELDQFREMHDHRHTGEWMGEEGDSWLRAIRSMAGGAGKPGSRLRRP